MIFLFFGLIQSTLVLVYKGSYSGFSIIFQISVLNLSTMKNHGRVLTLPGVEHNLSPLYEETILEGF